MPETSVQYFSMLRNILSLRLWVDRHSTEEKCKVSFIAYTSLNFLKHKDTIGLLREDKKFPIVHDIGSDYIVRQSTACCHNTKSHASFIDGKKPGTQDDTRPVQISREGDDQCGEVLSQHAVQEIGLRAYISLESFSFRYWERVASFA